MTRYATIETNRGTMTAELYDKEAPNTVANFEKLANSSFYDGVKFPPRIPDFVVQGGDRTHATCRGRPPHGTAGPDTRSTARPLETTQARARRAFDGSRRQEYGCSQFFIVLSEETPDTDGVHTVFGKVTGGVDVSGRSSRTTAMTKVRVSDSPSTPRSNCAMSAQDPAARILVPLGRLVLADQCCSRMLTIVWLTKSHFARRKPRGLTLPATQTAPGVAGNGPAASPAGHNSIALNTSPCPVRYPDEGTRAGQAARAGDQKAFSGPGAFAPAARVPRRRSIVTSTRTLGRRGPGRVRSSVPAMNRSTRRRTSVHGSTASLRTPRWTSPRRRKVRSTDELTDALRSPFRIPLKTRSSRKGSPKRSPLSRRARSVIVLHDVEGFKHAETERCSEFRGTARSDLHTRARSCADIEGPEGVRQ